MEKLNELIYAYYSKLEQGELELIIVEIKFVVMGYLVVKKVNTRLPLMRQPCKVLKRWIPHS